MSCKKINFAGQLPPDAFGGLAGAMINDSND